MSTSMTRQGLDTAAEPGEARIMRLWLGAGVLTCMLLAGCSASSTCGFGFERVGDECEPVCVTECGDHEKCNVDMDAATARCECVAGYAGDPCEWTGGLRDPGFASDDAWVKSNGATVLPLATGISDPGIASFESIVTCSAGAISQIVDMPAYDDAEPFAIQVTFRHENVPGVDVGYGRAFRKLKAKTLDWNTDRFCVGEAAYGEDGNGGPVKFQIAAAERLPDCFSAPNGLIEVDRFEIVVASEGECPPPGEVLNGEANVDQGGWRFEVERSGVGATTASLESGVGESGSDGARIYKPAEATNLAGMFTEVSVPVPSEQLPSPALRYWWRGGESWRYYVDLGTYPGTRSTVRPLDSLTSDGEPEVATYCLPPWTYGNVADLAFVLQGGLPADEAELIVDQVEIISDPRCGTSTDLLDPSFDSAPNRWPGVYIVAEAGTPNAVSVLNDPDRARPPGVGFLELRYARNDIRIDAQTWVWIPPSEGNRGPQLVFHSEVPATPGVSVFWSFGRIAGLNVDCTDQLCSPIPLSEELPPGLGWRRNQACLPAEWAERWYRLRVAIRPSEEPLEVFDPPRAVLLDDFEVRLDEECPPATP